MLSSCLLNFQVTSLIPLDMSETIKAIGGWGGVLIPPNSHFTEVRENVCSDIFTYWRKLCDIQSEKSLFFKSGTYVPMF